MSQVWHDFKQSKRIVAVRTDGKGLALRPLSSGTKMDVFINGGGAGFLGFMPVPANAVAAYITSGGGGTIRISIGNSANNPNANAGIQLAAQVNCPLVVVPGENIKVFFTDATGVASFTWLEAV